ncbi:MAG: polysaccharide biosynthesis C-terminal domain-containing protein, partial [Elusimicrobiales bacterium]
VPSSLSSVIIQLIDRPIMMHFLSPYFVGLYQANFRLAVFMNLIVSMFDFAWRPFVIERAEKRDSVLIFKKVFEYFSFVVIYFFLIISVLIKSIITIPIGNTYLINPNYWSASDVIPIVMIGYIFLGFYICFMASTIITKKTFYSMNANLISSLISVILNFLLIPIYGIYGAAYSFVASNFMLAAYMYFTGERIMRIGYPIFKVAILFISTVLLYIVIDRLSYGCRGLQIKVFAILIWPFLVGAFGYFEKNDVEHLKNWLRKKIFG